MKTYCGECSDSGTGMEVVRYGDTWLCQKCYENVARSHYLLTGNKLSDFEMRLEKETYDNGGDDNE